MNGSSRAPNLDLVSADALGHGADPPGTAEDGYDPVRFAQLLRPQHDPVIPVELHLLILPYGRDN